jgi:fluoride exporter
VSTTRVPARHLVAVGVGGAIGALARVALATTFPAGPGRLPWVTLVENLGGALALAFVLTWLTERVTIDPVLRLALCTGMLGAFTTYSTLAVELTGLLTGRHVVVAIAYFTASLTFGVLGAVTGIRLARRPPGTHHTGSPTSGPT